jgi:16S rRNA (cytosine967-C5)-methyltransferase
MPASPARVAAFDILLHVETEDAYASELLHSEKYAKLSPEDRRLATEIVMGVLRWKSALDDRIAAHSSQQLKKLDPEVLAALRIAAYQLIYLDRVPGRAAVNESVELVKRAHKRSAAPFANAVLRKLADSVSDSPPLPATDVSSPQLMAKRFAHPLWLVERWIAQYGSDFAARISTCDQNVPPTAIRLANAAVENELRGDGVSISPGQLLTSARRVSGEITKTSAFREGKVFIQDEASQLVALLVGRGASILDCCAAPGGKTRVIAERNPESTVVATELHPHRARLLSKLVAASNVEVIAGDIRELSPGDNFDRVLADVPCSGTGTLAKNPEIKWRLRPEDLLDLQQRQVSILKSAMSRVARGGRVIYSTCSLEPEENEYVVENALTTNGQFRLLDCRTELERLRSEGELAWEAIESLVSGSYLRTIPGVHPCDGFFAAILEKPT